MARGLDAATDRVTRALPQSTNKQLGPHVVPGDFSPTHDVPSEHGPFRTLLERVRLLLPWILCASWCVQKTWKRPEGEEVDAPRTFGHDSISMKGLTELSRISNLTLARVGALGLLPHLLCPHLPICGMGFVAVLTSPSCSEDEARL